MITKLTQEQIHSIPYEYAYSSNSITTSNISKKYKVSISTILTILKQSIENLKVPRSTAIKIQRKVIKQAKDKKNYLQISESFNHSIFLLDSNISSIEISKNNLDEKISKFKFLLKIYDECYSYDSDFPFSKKELLMELEAFNISLFTLCQLQSFILS